jgi:HD superfamily phosphohydrolase/serine/threonine protein kinase
VTSPTPEQVLEFDLAFALGMLGPGDQLPFKLPPRLEVPEAAQDLLNACIELSSITKSTCQIKSSAPQTAPFALHVGQDVLYLQPDGYVLAGGSGINIQLHDPTVGRSYALKVPKMSVLAYQTPDGSLDARVEERFSNEYKAFQIERQLARRLSHENIAQHVYGSQKFILSASGGNSHHYPYSVSEWIEGAKPLTEHLLISEPSAHEIVGLIRQCFRALKYIHNNDIVHWDLKSDNILVSNLGTIKIIDFGNAKYLKSPESETDIWVTTTKGKHPARRILKPVEGAAQGSRRFLIKLPNISWNHPFIDLWMMAQEWNRCFYLSPKFLEEEEGEEGNEQRAIRQALVEKYRNAEALRVGDDVWQSLELIFDRILYPLVDESLSRLGTDAGTFDVAWAYYSNAREVLHEIDRIEPLLGAGQSVPELLVALGDVVRLPVTGNSVFTRRVADITNSAIASPTKLHLQLAQVREVYPGATHTRHEHMLGTVTTASYFLRSLYLNEMNAFWRISASGTDLRAVLLAAILHDVGHIAYGHFIEEMGDLMRDAGHVDCIQAFLQAARRYVAELQGEDCGSFPPHRIFSFEPAEVEEFCSIVQKSWCDDEGLTPGSLVSLAKLLERVAAILGPRLGADSISHLTRSGTRRALAMIMKSIVDGPLDADKLDYLRRDSLHAGVMYANGIDLERFFESLRVCLTTENDGTPNGAAIGISDKGIAAIESIITARYHLFSVVYWHRTVRGITATLQRVLVETFLALDDTTWHAFRRDFVKEFRLRDDRAALDWLRDTLDSHDLLHRRVANGESEDPGESGVTIADLVAALRGSRDKYFKTAFELNYSGLVGESAKSAVTASDLQHDAVSAAFYNAKPEDLSVNRRASRRKQRELRIQLEQMFCQKVDAVPGLKKKKGSPAFRIDTILIDVPEGNKDQIAGLYVDHRSKRARQRFNPEQLGRPLAVPEFEEISRASPIAAAMSEVFRRWARRIRIFMTPQDLDQLKRLGLGMGDIATIWEQVLAQAFPSGDRDQLAMPGVLGGQRPL